MASMVICMNPDGNCWRVMSSPVFDADYLDRLRRGDEAVARHFHDYFRRMLRLKLWSKFGRRVPPDLLDEIIAAALEKIMRGEPRDPACLPAYVRAICVNLARKTAANPRHSEIAADHIDGRVLTAEQTMLAREQAENVRSVLSSLKPRDRRILVDLYYNEIGRELVCQKYGVTREQLRLILFRARGRFQKRWSR